MIRLVRISLLVLCFGSSLRGQFAPAAASPNSPEDGFISNSKYTNSFFGFAVAIPGDKSLQRMDIPSSDHSKPFLFGFKSFEHGVSVFFVTGAQMNGASSDDARKAASGPKGQSVKRIEIGGKEFWRSESLEKTPGGKMHVINYAAAMAGYVLSFRIASFSDKFTDEIEHAVQSMTFFEPSKAKEIAGMDALPYNPAAISSRSPAGSMLQPSGSIGELSQGSVSGNIYTNEPLGFSYEFPAGWFLADKHTQEKVTETGHKAAWGNSPGAAREHEAVQKCSKILLWANKLPEGTQTEEINPIIVIVAVDPACFPGTRFPTSIEDQGSAKEIGEAMVRSFQSGPMTQGDMKLGLLSVQGRIFIDVSGVAKANVPGRPAPVETHYATLMTSLHNLWIGWLFGGRNEAELQQLRNTKLTFSGPAVAP